MKETRPDNLPPFFQFEALEGLPGIRHGVFTRRGGVSRPPYRSLNVGMSVGDDPEDVSRNRRLLENCFPGATLRFVKQVHGDGILKLRGGRPPEAPAKADALITDRPGVLLAIQTADCQAVLLADPVRRVVAGVHAGWRGSVLNIVGRTVRTMITDYDVRPEHIVAGIGPSLGPCCGQFIHYRRELPEALHKYRAGGDLFDFWAITRDQLIAEGLSGTNIHTSGLCTRCRPDLFFSYRGEKTTGRIAAVIGLEEAHYDNRPAKSRRSV